MNKLKQILKEREISIAKLSIMSNVPVRTIEDIIKRGDCRVSTALKIADALNIKLDDLCR